MYGAGTGGLLLMQSLPSMKLRQTSVPEQTNTLPLASAEYMTGSYNLQNVFASAYFGEKDNQSLITFAHNSSDGYRDHSRMRRNNASFVSRNNISTKQQLTASFLFTDLFYETPGGLTKTEFDANPKAARPAAGGITIGRPGESSYLPEEFISWHSSIVRHQ